MVDLHAYISQIQLSLPNVKKMSTNIKSTLNALKLTYRSVTGGSRLEAGPAQLGTGMG